MGELQIIQGGDIAARQAITADLYNRFISYIDASPKTVETYGKALKQFFRYLYLNDIGRPQREDVIAFRDELKASGHKPTTVQGYVTAVRLFFKWTDQAGLYPNVADHLKGAKLDREHKKGYLTSGQVKDVLSGVERDSLQGKRDYAILTLMVTGGLRTIEVIRANVGDITTAGDNTVIYLQGKGRDEKAEYVKLSAPVDKAIRDYLRARGAAQDNEPLFTSTSNNNKGKRLTTRSISGIVKARLCGAGYDSNKLTAHSLRHTAVTLSLLAGRDLAEVQQFARHASISTTMIYNHAIDKAKNGCSEAITAAIF